MKDAIETLLKEGKNPREIRNLVGCSAAYVTNVRVRLGMPKFLTGRKRGVHTARVNSLCLEAKAWTGTQAELARKHGFSKQRVGQLLHMDKHDARSAVQLAIKDQRLVRAVVCERCGQPAKTEAHHADYSKPLEIEWLCRGCHRSVPLPKRNR